MTEIILQRCGLFDPVVLPRKSKNGEERCVKVFRYFESSTIYAKVWLENGKIHRKKKPAMIFYFKDGAIGQEVWCQKGKVHRDKDKPAVITYDENGVVVLEQWCKDGKLHRDKGLPARVGYYPDGAVKYKIWAENGLEHSSGGLSSMFLYPAGNASVVKFKRHGKFYRPNDKPTETRFFENGTRRTELWQDPKGLLHRKGKPAVIHYEDCEPVAEEYWEHGKRSWGDFLDSKSDLAKTLDL